MRPPAENANWNCKNLSGGKPGGESHGRRQRAFTARGRGRRAGSRGFALHHPISTFGLPSSRKIICPSGKRVRRRQLGMVAVHGHARPGLESVDHYPIRSRRPPGPTVNSTRLELTTGTEIAPRGQWIRRAALPHRRESRTGTRTSAVRSVHAHRADLHGTWD